MKQAVNILILILAFESILLANIWALYNLVVVVLL